MARAARLEDAKRYIDDHLSDPDLTPVRAAREVGISLRQLHLLFAADGESFAHAVLRRRLERARTELMTRRSEGSLVAEIACASGFSSLATFYRNFRRAYGMAPGHLRDPSVRHERGRLHGMRHDSALGEKTPP